MSAIDEPTWLEAFKMVRSDRRSMRLLLIMLVLHGILANWMNLSVDEAHYALYARHLDWSYFDHPPLVGWIQWPALHIGSQDFTMRLASLLCWALTALTTMTLTQRLFWSRSHTSSFRWHLTVSNPNTATKHSGLRSDLLLFVLSPLFNLLGIALVPDSLLMLLSCLVMALVWTLATTAGTLKQWVSLGVILGLAGLSKYSSGMLGVGVILALFSAKGWRLILNPGPWVALLLVMLLISPILYWNATHEWISFSYQFHHATGKTNWELKRVISFVLVQCLCFGFLLPIGLWAAWRSRHLKKIFNRLNQSSAPLKTLSPLNYTLMIALPLLLVVTLVSGRGDALPHWTASAWVMLIPAAATGCSAIWHTHRGWIFGLGGFQVISCSVMIIVLLTGGIGGESGAQALSRPGELISQAPLNPIADLYGWKTAALQARALAQQHKIKTLAVMNWSMASRLAWYAQPSPVKVIYSHHDQFDLWFGALKRGESVLLVDWSIMGFSPPIAKNQFSQCDWLAQQPVLHAGRQIAHFNFMLCREWQGDLNIGRASL